MYVLDLNSMVNYDSTGLNIAACLAVESTFRPNEVYLIKVLYSNTADVLLEVGLYVYRNGKYDMIYKDSSLVPNIPVEETNYIYELISKHNNALVRMAGLMGAVTTKFRLIADTTAIRDMLSVNAKDINRDNSLIFMVASDKFVEGSGDPKYIIRTYLDLSDHISKSQNIIHIIESELSSLMNELNIIIKGDHKPTNMVIGGK